MSRLPLLPHSFPPRRLLSSKPHRLTFTMHSSSSSSSARPETETRTRIQQAIEYHNRTKHSLTAGYARGPHGLDWANQPNPFLLLSRAPALPLLHFPPPAQSPDSPPYPSLFSGSPSPPQPLNLDSVSRLFYDSLSLSAWKSTGISTWSLRVNPSSGNLHPTETHLLAPALSPSPLLAHYTPKTHSLQCRSARIPDSLFPSPSSSLLSLSSIIWREAWKYGERAFRYCNHDVGHAIAAVTVAAAALGWDVRLMDGLGHGELHGLLGLDKLYPSSPPSSLLEKPIRGKLPWVEAQHPDCLLLVFPFGDEEVARSVDYGKMREVIGGFGELDWVGAPNSLSKEHVCWDVIYRTAEAVKKPFTGDEDEFTVNPLRPSGLISEELYKKLTVRELVRKRRSAVDMDGVHVMKKETFYQILLHCLPSGELGLGEKQGKQMAIPFRALTWDAEVHCVLFVHRVKGLEKGLYFLVRNEEHLERLKKAMRADFDWVKPEDCPEGLPLYRLARGNCERLAKQLSCNQV